MRSVRVPEWPCRCGRLLGLRRPSRQGPLLESQRRAQLRSVHPAPRPFVRPPPGAAQSRRRLTEARAAHRCQDRADPTPPGSLPRSYCHLRADRSARTAPRSGAVGLPAPPRRFQTARPQPAYPTRTPGQRRQRSQARWRVRPVARCRMYRRTKTVAGRVSRPIAKPARARTIAASPTRRSSVARPIRIPE